MIKNQNYRIIQLGVGKYTKVYCMELETDKKVAVKVLKSEYEKNKFFQDQLIKEARLGMQIKHPSARRILDIVHNDDDNTYQIMMEYLEGYNMQEYIQNFGSIPEKQVTEWLKAILPALIETHRKGIVHGLLKPGNLIINPKGKLKICDFKGAYFESELFPENVDADDILFLSPEQIQHIGPISQSSDIYTLGVTIYTLLSGRDPYDAKNADVDEIRLRILNEPLPFVEKASLKLNSIIQAATAKNPKERFPMLESMLDELDGGEFRKKAQLTEEDLFSQIEPIAVADKLDLTEVADNEKANLSDFDAATKFPEAFTENPSKLPETDHKMDHQISEENSQILVPDSSQPFRSESENSNQEVQDDKEELSIVSVPDQNDEKPIDHQSEKEHELSLEDRAQAVWDKIGISKSEKSPNVSQVPDANAADVRSLKSDQKSKKSGSELPLIKEEVITEEENLISASPKRSEYTVEKKVIAPKVVIPKQGDEINNPKSPILQPVHFIDKTKENKDLLINDPIEEIDSEQKKARWFLPSLIIIGLLVGGYFLFQLYIDSQQSELKVTRSDAEVKDSSLNKTAVTEIIPVVTEATADSLIQSDSSISLADLETAKLEKVKELEAIKKKRQEEKEKEAANAIDKNSIEILGPYVGQIAPYRYKNLIGFIDKDGKIIRKPIYNDILNYSSGLAPVNENGKWGFVNTSGEEVIKTKYNEIFGFSKGLAGAKKDGKWGFINSSGKTVVPFEYDVLTDFADGLAGVRKNGKWGFVNKNGVEAIQCQFDNAWSFKDGLAGVEKNNKWGFINKSGVSVIELKYGQVNNFIEGYACVEKNGKYGFINKDGVEVINCVYEAAKPFKNGTARVFTQGKWIYINKVGKCVRDCN